MCQNSPALNLTSPHDAAHQFYWHITGFSYKFLLFSVPKRSTSLPCIMFHIFYISVSFDITEHNGLQNILHSSSSMQGVIDFDLR